MGFLEDLIGLNKREDFEVGPGETDSEEIKAEETKSEEEKKAEESKAEDTKETESKDEETKVDEVEVEEVKAEEAQSEAEEPEVEESKGDAEANEELAKVEKDLEKQVNQELKNVSKATETADDDMAKAAEFVASGEADEVLDDDDVDAIFNVVNKVDVVSDAEESDDPKESTAEPSKTKKFGRDLKVPDFLVDARMKARELKFYNSLGEMALENYSTGKMPKDLEDYIFEAIQSKPDYFVDKIMEKYLEDYLICNPKETNQIIADRIDSYLDQNPEKVDQIVSSRFEEYLGRHMEDVHQIDKSVLRVFDANVEIGVRFVKKNDGSKVYSTWEQAVASIQDVIDEYGIDPEDVFDKEYYRLDNPDQVIDLKEVHKYMKNFRGDNKKLRKNLHLVGNSSQKRRPQKGSKKPNQTK